MTNVRNRRMPRACAVLLCALGILGCSENGEGGAGPAQTIEDGGMDASQRDSGPRIGPGGARAWRERPDDTCRRAQSADSAYWFCETPIKATRTQGTCSSAGGTPVVIDDAAENEFITGELIEPEYTIGYSDAAGERDWIWGDGTTAGYENWGEGEPGPADFAFIARDSGQWFTTTDLERPYICEDWK